MHEAWKDLISRKPRHLPPSAAVRRLRALTRELHIIFAEARALAELVTKRTGASAAGAPMDQFPLGRPGAWALIKFNAQRHSRSLLVVMRVAIATVVAGGLAGLIGLDHAYWAMSAAVLVLHQGLDRRRTTQRAPWNASSARGSDCSLPRR